MARRSKVVPAEKKNMASNAANNMLNTPLPSWLGCPICGGPLDPLDGAMVCARDDLNFPIQDGILRALLPAERRAADEWATDYRRRREEQGWRPLSPEEMSVLPETAPAGWDRLYWPARSQSFQVLEAEVRRLASRVRQPLQVVDMGAGFGWLGGRWAAAGHAVVALDLSCDEVFGLGAAREMAQALALSLTLVQGDIDQPPLQPQSADLLVYNASLHYAADISRCLARGVQTLRPDGALVIMDSPVVFGQVTAVPASQEQGSGPRRGRQLTEAELTEALTQAGLIYEFKKVPRGFRWRLSRWRLRLVGLAPFELPFVYARLP
jgi:SAM-dependent methyltransferase